MPSNFEEQTSSQNLNFMEHSFATNIVTNPASAKRPAITAVGVGERWYLGGGVSFEKQGIATTDEQTAFNGRAAVVPIMTDEALVHLGVNGWYIPNASGGNVIVFNDRPESRVDGARWIEARPALSSFGNDDGFDIGAELAARWRSFWVQGEYNHFGFDQTRNAVIGSVDPPDVSFDAYYASLGWILTGEHKLYSMSSASWTGVSPAHPFDFEAGGWGAWELAFRYSFADLDDGENTFDPVTGSLIGVRGGRERNFTVGLNWYLNDNMRIMVNYINVNVDRLNSSGLQIGDNFDIATARFQVNW